MIELFADSASMLAISILLIVLIQRRHDELPLAVRFFGYGASFFAFCACVHDIGLPNAVHVPFYRMVPWARLGFDICVAIGIACRILIDDTSRTTSLI